MQAESDILQNMVYILKQEVFMKKVLFLLLILPLIFTACKKDDDDDSNDDISKKTLWTKTEDGYTKIVKLTTGSDDGITTLSVSYSIQDNSTGKGLAFAVMKMTGGKNTVYKGAIAAKSTTEAFPHGYWDEYKISKGQSTVSMTDALSFPDNNENGYEFLIMGGLSESGVNALKNAIELTISLSNSTDDSRDTSFTCDYEFIKALLKYM